jgi:hypothetical protein
MNIRRWQKYVRGQTEQSFTGHCKESELYSEWVKKQTSERLWDQQHDVTSSFFRVLPVLWGKGGKRGQGYK